MTTRLTMKENAKRFTSVVQALQTREATCTHCATEFGKNGRAETMACCIGVHTDCTEYCAFTRKFLEHNSEFTELLLEDCAEIRPQCAEECDHHGQGHRSACATAHHACLDACLKTAGVEAITAEPIVF